MGGLDESVEERFLKYDYAETKDLLKVLISLLSATLVVSITFSEKIAGLGHALTIVRYGLFGAWSLFIAALVFAGLGLCFIAAAAGKVIYGTIPMLDFHYYRLALVAWSFTVGAGTAFVAGLIALTIAGAQGFLHSV